MITEQDSSYLRRTIDLAEGGRGAVSPNPMVGALVVRGNKVVGEGYHRSYGGPHAETHALIAAGAAARGAVLYCNLEPCSYTAPGKHQPPCTRRIIESGVRRVVIGQVDPNPHVRGSGMDQLRRAGLEVDLAEDSGDCWRLNDAFNTWMALRRPFVHGFLGLSPEGTAGFAASVRGASAPGDAALDDCLKNLLTGRDAIAIDLDAELDAGKTASFGWLQPLHRLQRIIGAKGGNHPILIFDRFLRTPLDSDLLGDYGDRVLIIAGSADAEEGDAFAADVEGYLSRPDAPGDSPGSGGTGAVGEKERLLTASGVRVIRVSESGGRREGLPGVLWRLKGLGITSMLVLGSPAAGAKGNRFTMLRHPGFFDRITAPADVELPAGGLGAEAARRVWDMDAARRERVGDRCFIDVYHRDWLSRVQEFQGVHPEEMGREAC